MASLDDRTTRVQPPPASAPPPAAGHDRLDLRTLIITALASAAAAFICSKVWVPGTLASAAFTPVAVALFREGLRRPTAVVSQALPAVSQALPVGRRSASTPSAAADDGTLRTVGPDGPARPAERTAVQPGRARAPYDPAVPYDPGVAPYEAAVPADATTTRPPMTVYSAKRPFRHRWRLALITGLLGFAIAAVVVTVPELIAGGSASGSGNTTFFNSPRKAKTSSSDTPKTTTTEKTKTETKTETVPAPTTTTAPKTTKTTPTETTPTTPQDPATSGGTGSGATGQSRTPGTTDTTPATPPADPAAGSSSSGTATTP